MTAPHQLPLALPSRAARGRDVFFEAAPNRQALAVLEGWRTWPSRKCLLIGPHGSGKTHLAHVWADQSNARIVPATDLTRHDLPEGGAVVIEDAHCIAGNGAAQEALFHWHNAVLGAPDGTLLVTGTGRLAQWGLTLPDLVSRLEAASLARLEPPDDPLLMAVLVKLFEDRHITPAPALIPYLTKRIERSFAAAANCVAALDRMALASDRPVGLAVARDLFKAEQTGSDQT